MIITKGNALNDFVVIDDNHALGTIWILSGSSSMSLPLESSHSSTSILVKGTQSPVKKNAHITPIPASIPNDLNAAILEVRFAEKATIVVTEVSITASPTLLIEVLHDSSIVLPPLLSSLYLWRECKLSSISRAKISMGSRLENWERKINSKPVLCPKIIAQPILSLIHI